MPLIAHSGLGVTDLDQSIRFYTELLGFEHCRTLEMPAEHVTDFMRFDRPRSLKAIYLMMGDFQLELIALDPPGENKVRDRDLSDTGLTHISVGVDSVPAVIDRLSEYGGELLSRIEDKAAMIRDPDGQIVEILDGTYAAKERLLRD